MGALIWKILGSLVKKGLSGLLLLQIRVFCLLSLTPLLGNGFKYPDLIYYESKGSPWVNAHGRKVHCRDP